MYENIVRGNAEDRVPRPRRVLKLRASEGPEVFVKYFHTLLKTTNCIIICRPESKGFVAKLRDDLKKGGTQEPVVFSPCSSC